MAAYFAFLQPGDTYMALDLSARRPSDARQPGQLLQQASITIVHYGVTKETSVFNYDLPSTKQAQGGHKPKMITVTGATVISQGS
jgi:glycine/serine hydroxymethyltransferase